MLYALIGEPEEGVQFLEAEFRSAGGRRIGIRWNSRRNPIDSLNLLWSASKVTRSVPTSCTPEVHFLILTCLHPVQRSESSFGQSRGLVSTA